MNNYTYTYACRNIFNTIRTSEDTSLEKYTTHFIWKGSKGLLKVLQCERWVGDWTELQHIDPYSYGHNSVSFPFSWGCSTGGLGPSLSRTWSSFQHLLSNWLELQMLNRGSWGPPLLGARSLYSILPPTDSNVLCIELHYCFTSTQLNLSFICRCLPPDTTWHKVKSPKAD